jgi:hypothetical protein
MGAAAIAAPTIAPWAFLAALGFAAAGVVSGLKGMKGALMRLVTVTTAAVCNVAILWVFVLGNDARVSAAEFRSKDFHVHTFLTGVPLHDVWAFRLRGGEDPTIQDVRAVFSDGTLRQTNLIVIGLVGLRSLLGYVFEWDDEKCDDPASSYVHRLSESDRLRSLEEPEPNGFIYTFEHEALAEIVNCTVHAFLVWAWEPAEQGYTLYWAIYVKPVSDFTPYYMALIDPFRRLFIYPLIVKRVEQGWSAKWESQRTVGGTADPDAGSLQRSLRLLRAEAGLTFLRRSVHRTPRPAGAFEGERRSAASFPGEGA